jgi:fumarate reductase flavoprotein subunit
VYPTAKPPYGGHLLPRRAAAVKSKLDLLTFRSLETATLRDGQYRERALGYAGDIHVTLSITSGRIADIQLRHEEKIDQNACVTVPQQIIERQSLQVDGISGATVTKNAIVDGVYRALKKAGLE